MISRAKPIIQNPSMSPNRVLPTAALAIIAVLPLQAAIVVGFDDLSSPPALDSATGLQFANGSSVYDGVVWDARTVVVGKNYRVDTTTPGPLFGIPHSVDYFITNESTDGGDGLTLKTSLVLTGAWFGRNEYYGFGAGADQITIVALHDNTALASVQFDLPENNDGQPEPLSFVDTALFKTVSGINGYRIDRRELGSQSGNWVADDFQFELAVVPEPSAYAVAAGLGLAAWALIRRRNAS